MMAKNVIPFMAMILSLSNAWTTPTRATFKTASSVISKSQLSSSLQTFHGNGHAEGACFLPLQQLDMDYCAPRIIQIAGSYPGLTATDVNAVTSEPSPEFGTWGYDFSDPDGPQLGTVAIEGTFSMSAAEDPIALIATHDSLKIPLPEEVNESIEVIVIVDRALNYFSERKFLLYTSPDLQNGEVRVGAFNTKSEMPVGIDIMGHVILTQIPWLACMKPTKTGFQEEDEYF